MHISAAGGCCVRLYTGLRQGIGISAARWRLLRHPNNQECPVCPCWGAGTQRPHRPKRTFAKDRRTPLPLFNAVLVSQDLSRIHRARDRERTLVPHMCGSIAVLALEAVPRTVMLVQSIRATLSLVTGAGRYCEKGSGTAKKCGVA